MRLLVYGGRDYTNRTFMVEVMQYIHEHYGPIRMVITGGAPGADTIADEIADDAGLQRVIYPANWNGQDKAAGAIRNSIMLAEGRPTHGLEFPGGTGTADMHAKLSKAGIEIFDALNVLPKKKRIRRRVKR